MVSVTLDHPPAGNGTGAVKGAGEVIRWEIAMRNIIKITMTPEVPTEMLTEGHVCAPFKCAIGLPKGSVLVNAFINKQDHLEFHFEHPSFPIIQEGEEPTPMKPTFEFQLSTE